MIDPNHITWVILAGGKATRMQGQDKGLIPFHGRPLVEHIIHQIQDMAPHILINANRNAAVYTHYAPVIADAIPDFVGPLAGLHTGLLHARTPWVGILPCDSPQINLALICRFLNSISEPDRVYVADDGDNMQPVFSVVHRSLLPELEHYLLSGQRKVRHFFLQHQATRVDCQDLSSVFINVNTPEQLAELNHEHP